MHSVVLFVEDINTASVWYSELLGSGAVKSGSFVEVGQLGFHPADEKSAAGSSVAYLKVKDVSSAIERAERHSFKLYRGPLTLDDVTIAQVKDKAGLTVGMIRTNGSNE